VDAELEALHTSAARVWDLVLDRDNIPSSLVASLSTSVELLEGQVDAMATNGVCYWTRSALVTALLHFLELLGSGCNMALREDQVNALWALACPASDFLASRCLWPPDGAGE
jgi:hypothetical protein